MGNEIYEVTYDDYRGFIDQLIPDKIIHLAVGEEEYNVDKIYSKVSKRCICEHWIPRASHEKELEEKFYIFIIPDEERKAARPIKRVQITEKEDAEKIMNILMNAMRKENLDD